MLPFKLEPAYKDYIWGGNKLKTDYNKKTELPIVAESWELSARPDASSVIADGELAGMPFSEFYRRYPQLCGTDAAGSPVFPVLIKLIDAKESLSVQVHPDDRYAIAKEHDLGKTEMWVVLDCEEGASLYYGFERPVDKATYQNALQNGTLTELLRAVPVKRGDVFYIPAGTIHAIGAGIVLAEIQENSNSTYRVYDYGRVGADGKPRPLHVGKALDVTRLTNAPDSVPGEEEPQTTPCGTVRRLASCPYFTVDGVELDGRFTFEADGSSFVSVLCTDGEGVLSANEKELMAKKGDSLFVPSDIPQFGLDGKGRFLFTTV